MSGVSRLRSGDRSAAIFEASARAAPLWLRVNRSKGSRDAYALRLQAADIVSTTEASLPDALRIDAPVAVSALPGFAEGDASVQDGAAQLVADALALPPGTRVLDACAAPGGKAPTLEYPSGGPASDAALRVADCAADDDACEDVCGLSD